MHDSAWKEKYDQIYNLLKTAESVHNMGLVYLAILYAEVWNEKHSNPFKKFRVRADDDFNIYLNNKCITTFYDVCGVKR